jgi:hypothetical protein
MFEIIMLFAFLYAATSQLFPERPTITRAPLDKKGRRDRESDGMPQRRAQKGRTVAGPSSKPQSRCHSYVRAA